VLYAFCFELEDWDRLHEADQVAIITRAVDALVTANVRYLTQGARWRTIPSLYASGIVFHREPDGGLNLWQNIPRVRAFGYGHCVALASWRVAELVVRDRELGAAPIVSVDHEVRPTVGWVQEFHVRVQRADGSIEDPSRRLGMP
jgi:hypothetical protein